MKKISVIFFLFIYALTVSGIAVHFHYCCGRLDDIRLSAVNVPGCRMAPGMNKGKPSVSHKDCCADRQMQLKVSGDQQKEDHTPVFIRPFADPGVGFLPVRTEYHPSFSVVHSPYAHPPPLPGNGLPVYLLNRVFRI